jgi:hypothetical protein
LSYKKNNELGFRIGNQDFEAVVWNLTYLAPSDTRASHLLVVRFHTVTSYLNAIQKNSESQSQGNAFRVYQIQIPIALNCHEIKYETDDADREMNTPQIM